jgi:hypothetical protein
VRALAPASIYRGLRLDRRTTFDARFWLAAAARSFTDIVAHTVTEKAAQVKDMADAALQEVKALAP